LRALLAHVDVVRLDHFRGFIAVWHVPAGATTAQSGEWVPGPGADFFSAVKKELETLRFIAEDLGVITPDVCALRDQIERAIKEKRAWMPLTSISTLERAFRTASRVAPFPNPLRFKKASGDE
jgi:hypothetical protein